MASKLKVIDQIPGRFLKTFKIKLHENEFGKSYQVNKPKVFYIRIRELTIYRSLDALYMQNNQMLVSFRIDKTTGKGSYLITVFN